MPKRRVGPVMCYVAWWRMRSKGLVSARRTLLALVPAAIVAWAIASCRPVVYVDPAKTPVASNAPIAVSADSATAASAATASARAQGNTASRAPSARPRAPRTVVSEVAPDIAREFRGVWVASVANIDWPSKRTLTTAEQQAELVTLLDRAVELKLNAIIFQVRPAADALYASKIEPWSEYLTGTQGKAPDPYWDPLEFAVREAHARHLELHAWFNPYRARFTDAKSPLAASHLANTNKSLVKPYGGYLWMDPGEPRVRERTLRVVLDVVRRYDVDGVHIDDYFYPYPETTKRGAPIPFPDDASWKRYTSNGGALSRADWRRNNVDLLVEQLHDSIHAAKPWVRFGVSPFGIWRPGYPAQIKGFDAYDKLYADARKWLREGWVDYFTPQLYWPTTKAAQSYPVLLQWWAEENAHGKHLWPGNFSSRAGATGSGAFPVAELVEQIRVTREQPGATGNVHFSMKSFLQNQAKMNDALLEGPYVEPALVPATPWLQAAPPPVPAIAVSAVGARRVITLGTHGKPTPWQWVVQWRTEDGWSTRVLAGSTTSLPLSSDRTPETVTVRAINRVGVESAPISLTLSESSSNTAPRRVRR